MNNITGYIEYVTIPKAEYDRLKRRIDWLECLEAAGVDNWCGMEYAMDLWRENRGTSSDVMKSTVSQHSDALKRLAKR